MKTTLKTILLATLGAMGCAQASDPTTAPAPPVAVGVVASAMPGDVTPKQLYPLPASATGGPLLQVSSPASPTQAVPYPTVEATEHRDAFLLIDAGAAKSHTILVDSPDGAALYFGVRGQVSESETTAALNDIRIYDPAGALINVRAPKPGRAAPAAPVDNVPLTGHPAGAYTIQLGPIAAARGLFVEAQQSTSTLVMTLQPTTPQLLLGGDEAWINLSLADGGVGVTGAQIRGEVWLRDQRRPVSVAFVELGKGSYRAPLGNAFGLDDESDVYSIRVWATGVNAAGNAFSRFGLTGVAFAVPTARIVSASRARPVKEPKSGKIAYFDIDVVIDAASTDRYEVSGILAGSNAGTEVRVGEAQTAGVFDEGTHTLTLRFDAGMMKYTDVSGPYTLRALQLYSQGRNALYHRLGAGMGVTIPTANVADFVTLAEKPVAIEGLIEDGLLPTP